MARGRWADDSGEAEVKKDHKREPADNNPDGIYSGSLKRIAISDGTFFPEVDRPAKKVLPKGQKSKGE